MQKNDKVYGKLPTQLAMADAEADFLYHFTQASRYRL